jgi:hypothetical protein
MALPNTPSYHANTNKKPDWTPFNYQKGKQFQTRGNSTGKRTLIENSTVEPQELSTN